MSLLIGRFKPPKAPRAPINHFLQKVFPCVTLQGSMKIFCTFRVEVLFKWAVATINKESQDNSTKFNIQIISHILTKPEERAKKTEQKTAWRRKTSRLCKKTPKNCSWITRDTCQQFLVMLQKKNSNKQSYCSPKHELFTGTTWESLRGLMVKPWNMNKGPKFKSCQACGIPCLFPFFLYFTTASYHNKHLFKPLKDESFFSNRGQNIVHNSVIWQGYK